MSRPTSDIHCGNFLLYQTRRVRDYATTDEEEAIVNSSQGGRLRSGTYAFAAAAAAARFDAAAAPNPQTMLGILLKSYRTVAAVAADVADAALDN